MRRNADSYLVPKTWLKQRAMTLRVPLQLHDDLATVRERAERAGFVFDVQTVLVEALERAVRTVGGQLEGLEQGEAGTPEQKPRRQARKRRVEPVV